MSGIRKTLVRITHVKLLPSGMQVYFSMRPTRVWAFTPGAGWAGPTMHFKQMYFPGMFDVQEVIDLINTWTKRKPHYELVDDNIVLIQESRLYIKRQYKKGCGKKLPHPHKTTEYIDFSVTL